MNNQPKEIIEFIVKVLVNNPDNVEIEQSTDEMGVLLVVHVDPADMGIIIGREGSTISMIRQFARIIGMKSRMRLNVKIFDPNPNYKPRKFEGEPRPAPRGNILDEVGGY